MTEFEARYIGTNSFGSFGSSGFKGIPEFNNAAWPDPEEIKPTLLPVEPLDLEILPKILRQFVSDVSERLQAPPDFVAAPAIVMFGKLIGTACVIKPKRYDDWEVIPNLWGGIIGPPSIKKSPCTSAAFKPLDRLEAKAEQAFEDARNDHEVIKITHELRMDGAKNQLKNYIKGNDPDKSLLIAQQEDELRDLQQHQPEPPVTKRYRTNDTTVEKLGELLQQNPRGLLVERDELTGLLTSWDKAGHESDRAFYLECWNSDRSFSVDRIKRGSIRIDKACASLFGGIQPARLEHYLERMTTFENDGLIQRFQLLVYPDVPAKFKNIDRAPNREIFEQVCNIAEKLSESDFTEFGACKDDDEGTAYFNFDDAAQAHFNSWLEDLHNIKLRADDDPIILEHLAKYPKLVPSLALIFYLVDCVANNSKGPVSLDALERAMQYAEYLESHARRIYSIAANIKQQRAIALSKKIRAGKLKNGFTARDVYRNKWHLLTNREHVEVAVEELVEANWLRKQPIAKLNGGRSTEVYHINPKILDSSENTTAKTDKTSAGGIWELIKKACVEIGLDPKQLSEDLSKEEFDDIRGGALVLEGLKTVADGLRNRNAGVRGKH